MPGLRLWLLLTACQPSPSAPWSADCPGRPEAGDVVIAPVSCEDQLLSGGEGTGADLWVATAWYRAILRHPDSSMTLAGLGGGTLVDGAAWGSHDGLHEVVPLVDGGWLTSVEIEVEADSVVVRGELASAPGLAPVTAPGEVREVRYVPDPDSPWLEIEGADGLWVHARGRYEVLGGRLVSTRRTYDPDGSGLLDLGGAVVSDGSALFLGDSAAAMEWLGTVHVSGSAPDATSLLLLEGDTPVGRVRLDTPDFSTRVPASVTALRAEAPGHAASATSPPGEDLELVLGGAGDVELQLAWSGRPRPVLATWKHADGRGGSQVLGATGGALSTGAGDVTVTLSAGPEVHTTLTAEAPGVLRALLHVRGERSGWSRVVLGAPVDRSLDYRGTDEDALALQVGAGAQLAVLAPAGDVAPAVESDLPVRTRPGARLELDQGSILAWPWDASARLGAHGAPRPQGLTVEEGLAIAWGGPARQRFTALDLAALEAIPSPPWRVWPPPDYVRLDHPESHSWAPWFAWLDAGIDLVPVGPAALVDAPPGVAAAQLEDALRRGAACATSGHPGAAVAAWPWFDGHALLQLDAWGAGVDRAALLGPGGGELATWEIDRLPWSDTVVVPEASWWVLVVWEEGGEGWAATRPLWWNAPPLE